MSVAAMDNISIEHSIDCISDKPVEDIEVIKKRIQERISGMEYEKHVVRPLFWIDNTQGRNLIGNTQEQNLIKKFIQKILKQREKHKTGKISHVILYP